MDIPKFLERFPAIRFSACDKRRNPERKTFADYLRAVTSGSPIAATKETAPAWALCNSTGDSSGEPTGLAQLDFDHVADVAAMRRALIDYGGFLAVLVSYSGKGVVAFGHIGKRLATDPKAVEAYIYAPLRVYLRACGIADDAYELDTKCAKACQLRIESRDADAWVADRPARLYADPDDDAALDLHPVAALAQALAPADTPTPAGIAGALVAVSMAADLRSRMAEGCQTYAARAFCVVLGEPGSGKTTLLKAVQASAREIGVTVSDPKNAPTLREHICACGCDSVVEAPEPGSKAKPEIRLAERSDGNADPLLVCIDEAGQKLQSRVQDESCGSLAALLRQCNDSQITIEATVKQNHKGSLVVPAHVSVLLGSTIPQWASYAAKTSQENGESRRVAEFYQASAERDLFVGAPPAPDTATAAEILRRLNSAAELWRDAGTVLEPARNARACIRSACAWLCTRGGLDIPSAQSLVMCYATLCAGLRASVSGRACIEAADVAACMVILRHVVETRDRMLTARDTAKAKAPQTEGEIWADIQDMIAKCNRRDKLLAKFASRGDTYRRVYDRMIASKALICERDSSSGRYVLRLATEAELEAEAERTDAIRAQAATPSAPPLAAIAKPQAGAASPVKPASKAPEYLQCDAPEREERLLAYYTKFRSDHGLVEGMRNDTLSRLVWGLQRAGMWDAYAEDFVTRQALQCGLKGPEIAKIIRERKILEKS